MNGFNYDVNQFANQASGDNSIFPGYDSQNNPLSTGISIDAQGNPIPPSLQLDSNGNPVSIDTYFGELDGDENDPKRRRIARVCLP